MGENVRNQPPITPEVQFPGASNPIGFERKNLIKNREQHSTTSM